MVDRLSNYIWTMNHEDIFAPYPSHSRCCNQKLILSRCFSSNAVFTVPKLPLPQPLSHKPCLLGRSYSQHLFFITEGLKIPIFIYVFS